MENALPASSGAPSNFTWPDEASLAAFRAWLQGVPSRAAVDRYLPDRRTAGESSRSVIGRVKRQLVAFATGRAQAGLAATLSAASPFDRKLGKAGPAAIETLRGMPPPQPLLGDAVERWLPVRLVGALHAVGIRTLADLTLRVPRRRRWWAEIAGLGPADARHIEAFFAQHPALTERARALVTVNQAQELIPWERLVIPEDVDGSRGTFRAPRASCALDACNDYQAVNAWLSLHESTATQRAYRKEGERLMLWAIVERGRALSSLTTEDAIAYRAFLRHPGPRARWVGTPQPRSPAWRPFAGDLSARSAAYALSVLNALYRWLIEQRYVLANPFAGVKVRGGRPAGRRNLTRLTPSPSTSGSSSGSSLTAWSGPTAGVSRPRSGCASCWISPTPRACESASSWMLDWGRSTRTRAATPGSGSSARATRPERSCSRRWPAPPSITTLFNVGCP